MWLIVVCIILSHPISWSCSAVPVCAVKGVVPLLNSIQCTTCSIVAAVVVCPSARRGIASSSRTRNIATGDIILSSRTTKNASFFMRRCCCCCRRPPPLRHHDDRVFYSFTFCVIPFMFITNRSITWLMLMMVMMTWQWRCKL